VNRGRFEVDALDKQDAEELPRPADTTPFRHQEWQDS
jgi:hypothetical protein